MLTSIIITFIVLAIFVAIPPRANLSIYMSAIALGVTIIWFLGEPLPEVVPMLIAMTLLVAAVTPIGVAFSPKGWFSLIAAMLLLPSSMDIGVIWGTLLLVLFGSLTTLDKIRIDIMNLMVAFFTGKMGQALAHSVETEIQGIQEARAGVRTSTRIQRLAVMPAFLIIGIALQAFLAGIFSL